MRSRFRRLRLSACRSHLDGKKVREVRPSKFTRRTSPMTAIVYDKARAVRLVPILRSIMREIVERTAAVETLEAQLETLSEPQYRRTHAEERAAIHAALATNRRELRRANQELPRIGC